MPDYRHISVQKIQSANQQHGRALQLEAIAKAEATAWRNKFESVEPAVNALRADRDRFKRAFYAVCVGNLLALLGSAVWALGRIL